MIPQFLLIALGTFASEDLTCIATGVLISQGKLGVAAGILACLTGIVAGDLLLFFAGRWIGRPALKFQAVARFISKEKVDRASAWLSEKGLRAVLVSRFTPGLRTATYFAAGSLRTRFWVFAGYFVLASALWTPLLVGSTILFGERLLHAIFMGASHGLVAFAAISCAGAANLSVFRRMSSDAGRRRIVGFLKRVARWEFWPPWLAYLPLIPYLAYLALRYRSLTVFTAANPGILSGGFVGESKSAILSKLADAAAEFEVLPGGLESVAFARQWMTHRNVSFPIVLKPDVGERGEGVAVIRTDAEMSRYLSEAQDAVIIQRYVEGPEFGIFYYRYPGEDLGRIYSITEKHFPKITGDGQSTLRELILRDPRAGCMASSYEKASKRPMDSIPHAGEQVQLVEIGSHCRGAVFLDGGRWNTPALERAVDSIARAHPGFCFGRFDVRSPSLDALQAGTLTVIELNGVGAEATHIYDPSVGLLEAYRVLFRQWKLAFEIGALNRNAGARPMPLGELLRLATEKFDRDEAKSGATYALAAARP